MKSHSNQCITHHALSVKNDASDTVDQKVGVGALHVKKDSLPAMRYPRRLSFVPAVKGRLLPLSRRGTVLVYHTSGKDAFHY